MDVDEWSQGGVQKWRLSAQWLQTQNFLTSTSVCLHLNHSTETSVLLLILLQVQLAECLGTGRESR